MANPTVQEVLEVLRKTFNGVDLRAVVVALGDRSGWRNAFTVIRFSARTPQEISAEHEELKKQYELRTQVLNKHLGEEHNIEPYKGINIVLSAYPIGQFEQLVRRMPEGIIAVSSNRAFHIADDDILKIDLMQEEMYLQNGDYEDIGNRWPVYYWGCGQKRRNFQGFPGGKDNRPRLDSHDLDKQSRNFGFADFQQLVECVTGESFDQSSGHSFQILAPLYARITSVTSSSNTVKVIGRFHPALGELMLECSVYERGWSKHAGDRLLERVRISPQSVGQELAQFSEVFQLGKTPEAGDVKASLFKQNATRIDLHEERSPLGSGVLAFRVFTSFVPEDDITEYLGCLTSGTDIKNCRLFRRFTSRRIDELFEYVVTYLLGLCQLNPILLSNLQHDVIEGGLEAGSADIVASAQGGEPILVSCTMAMPDARKRNMLVSAQTAIANRTGMPIEKIRAILVTGKPSVSPSGTELLELAARDLGRLWGMCKQGNLTEARRLLGVQ